jgi:hypothetical protein
MPLVELCSYCNEEIDLDKDSIWRSPRPIRLRERSV